MIIDSNDLSALLMEVITLSPAQQRIFFHCWVHCPYPNSDDLSIIATGLCIHRRTVTRAMHTISQTKILSKTVHYKKGRDHGIQ